MASIRPMTAADIGQVAALEQEIFPQPWSERSFREELEREDRAYLVAEEDDRVVGYGGLLMVDDEAHVTTLAVVPGHRRRRLASRLLHRLAWVAVEAGMRHFTLEVRTDNVAARALYQRFGFVPVGVRKKYYQDDDALIMWAVDIDRPAYRERLDRIEARLEVGS